MVGNRGGLENLEICRIGRGNYFLLLIGERLKD